LIFIAAQLAMGRTSLWLPRAVGDRSLAKRDLQRMVEYGRRRSGGRNDCLRPGLTLSSTKD
jgi:hypothetical protein